jgi:hypothetical protein
MVGGGITPIMIRVVTTGEGKNTSMELCLTFIPLCHRNIRELND